MLLTELIDLILREKELPVVDGTRNNWYLPAVADFRSHLNHEPTDMDLSRECVNGWIDTRVREERLSRYTIKTRRGALLAIWRGAWELEQVDAPPTKIRKIKMRQCNPIAWTRDEVQQLFSYALHLSPDRPMKGTELPSRLFFASLIAAAYDTALRLGDLLALEREWIRTDEHGAGWLKIQQSKTGNLVSSRINPETMVLIDRLHACNSNRRLVWPIGIRRESFYARMRCIVRESGVRTGTFRFLRRASTTHIEQLAPGQAHIHAGHTDPAVTRRHYLDAEQLQSNAKSPLALIVTRQGG